MPDRVSFTTDPSTGARVLLMNFSGFVSATESLPHIAAAAEVIARQPPRSVHVLLNVTGSKCNVEVVEALKDLASHNRPYVIATAIIGMSGLQRIILDGVISFSGRSNLKSFTGTDDAFRWLSSQQ